jgi:haloacetate dehalogenase
MTGDLFPGFAAHWIDTEAGRIFARVGGSGPPIAMLHGFPQAHTCWHRIAPALAETHTVVCLDLRGYGWSSVPRSDANHETYSKRAMSRDVVAVMEQLGYVRFAIVGHDRGARVGYRLALDQPGRVERLALLDILPTFHVWQQIKAGAIPAAHWGFLARPYPQPEQEIGQDPLPYFDGLFARWSGDGTLKAFDPRALAAYHASCNEPNRIHAFCEDYRAGATLDVVADEMDLQVGKTISCPVLVLWGEFYLSRGSGAGAETTADVWRHTFAPHATGAQVNAGHFLTEENPADTLAALRPFLSSA